MPWTTRRPPRIEEAVIGGAPGQTTGQLRAAVRRAVLAVDPAAADRRRKKAEREARVEVWTETSGTAALAGRDLPPAEVLAADKRVDALARRLRADGAPGPLDLLRARVYTALLLGRPIESLLPGRDAAGERAYAGEHPRPGTAGTALAGTGLAGTGLAGTVNLTMPLATWLGMGNAPGEVAGFGPVDGDTCRTLGSALASAPGREPLVPDAHRRGRAGRGTRLHPAAAGRAPVGAHRQAGWPGARMRAAAGRGRVPPRRLPPRQLPWLPALIPAPAPDRDPPPDLLVPRLPPRRHPVRSGPYDPAPPRRRDLPM